MQHGMSFICCCCCCCCYAQMTLCCVCCLLHMPCDLLSASSALQHVGTLGIKSKRPALHKCLACWPAGLLPAASSRSSCLAADLLIQARDGGAHSIELSTVVASAIHPYSTYQQDPLRPVPMPMPPPTCDTGTGGVQGAQVKTRPPSKPSPSRLQRLRRPPWNHRHF